MIWTSFYFQLKSGHATQVKHSEKDQLAAAGLPVHIVQLVGHTFSRKPSFLSCSHRQAVAHTILLLQAAAPMRAELSRLRAKLQEQTAMHVKSQSHAAAAQVDLVVWPQSIT